MNAKSRFWGRNRYGFILPLSIVLIPLILLLSFSYGRQVRQEALRAHRVYWNDLVTKGAEGVAEEAYCWFLLNQDHVNNKIATFLKEKAGGGKTINFDSNILPFINQLKSTYGNYDVITKCTMKLVEEKFFFNQINSLPAGFNAVSQAIIYPDPDRYALLKVEVEANFQGFQRRYVVVREIKAVNILPGFLGQFTLFVKEKKDGPDYDWNHLKNNSTPTPPPLLDSFGFVKKDPSELSNPIVLINDKNDLARTCNTSEIAPKDVSPTPGPDWSTIDLTKRGWVFLGRNSTAGPLQEYFFHPLNGDIRTACNPAGIPPTIPTDRQLFFGGNFMLSNHTKLWYFLHLNDSNRPPFAHIVSGKVPVPVPSPDTLKDTARYQIGWIVWQTRYGFMSLTKSLLQAIPLFPVWLTTCYHLYKNYYEDPKHQVGTLESPDGSLILPMGDMFPLSQTQIADRRSPTVLLGTWMRFLQTGNVVQVDDDIKSALDMNPVGDWLAKFDNPSNKLWPQRPTLFWLPYFPIHVDRRNPSSPIVSFGPEPDFIGWSVYSIWAKVDNTSAPPTADFARDDYNVIDHIMTPLGSLLNTPGEPKNAYEIVMNKVIAVPGMMMYDLIVGNNMRGIPPSLFVPGSSYKLENFESTTLGKVLKPVIPSGASVAGTNLGKSFFYESPDNTTQAGRGISGNCIAIYDLNSRPLVIGNLGALWPFPEGNGNYNLAHKATHHAPDQNSFLKYFTYQEGGNTILDLKNGIVTISGDITISAGRSGKIIFKNGGVLIASDGEIIIKSDIQRDPGNTESTLVIATAKRDRDIKLNAGQYQAFFISSGTLKRETAGAIKIEGGVTVRYLEFKKSASSIFSGYPSTAESRQTIVWDNRFNVFDPSNYSRGIKMVLGGSMAYWGSEKMK